jgi:hypothetical protein
MKFAFVDVYFPGSAQYSDANCKIIESSDQRTF